MRNKPLLRNYAQAGSILIGKEKNTYEILMWELRPDALHQIGGLLWHSYAPDAFTDNA